MFFKDLLSGFVSYLKAFQIITSLRLWKYFLVPAMISIFLGGLIIFSAWGMSSWLGSYLLSWYPFQIGITMLSAISGWIGGAVLFIFGFIIYKHLVLVAVSPFMSPLAQKVEEHLTGHYSTNKGFEPGVAFKSFSRGLLVAVRNIIKEIFYVLILFLLGLIPLFAVPCAILIFLVQAYFAGFGNLDYTLERHFNLSASTRFVKKHRGLAIANGTVFLLLLMTGIGFLFAPPLSAVAGAVESVKRIEGVNDLVAAEQDFV